MALKCRFFDRKHVNLQTPAQEFRIIPKKMIQGLWRVPESEIAETHPIDL